MGNREKIDDGIMSIIAACLANPQEVPPPLHHVFDTHNPALHGDIYKMSFVARRLLRTKIELEQQVADVDRRIGCYGFDAMSRDSIRQLVTTLNVWDEQAQAVTNLLYAFLTKQLKCAGVRIATPCFVFLDNWRFTHYQESFACEGPQKVTNQEEAGAAAILAAYLPH